MKNFSVTFVHRQARFPKIALYSNGPEELVAALRPILGSLQRYRDRLENWEQRAYAVVANQGHLHAEVFLTEVPVRFQNKLAKQFVRMGILPEEEVDKALPFDEGYFRRMYLTASLGRHIFISLPKLLREKYFPYASFQVGCDSPRSYAISFSYLRRRASPIGGTVCYSGFRPTVEIAGTPKLVTFAHHMLDRLCLWPTAHNRRYQARWEGYEGLDDVHGLLAATVYFDIAAVRDPETGGDGIGLVLYEPIWPSGWQRRYVENILGDAVCLAPQYHRVGYLPIAEYEDHVVCKTFLPPGFSGTPEDKLWERLRSSKGAPSRRKIEKLRSDNIRDKLRRGEADFSVLKWFHENGVPQVLPMEHTVCHQHYYNLPYEGDEYSALDRPEAREIEQV